MSKEQLQREGKQSLACEREAGASMGRERAKAEICAMGGLEEEQEEEIRIVSQNCKLHSQSNVSFKSSIVHERFPFPAAREEQQQQSKRRAPVLARRRQASELEERELARPSRLAPSLGQASRLQRYVSMDNLGPICSLAEQRQQQRRPPRSASTSRPECEHQRLAGATCARLAPARGRVAPVERLYRRSNSVLGSSQPASCCSQPLALAEEQPATSWRNRLRCGQHPISRPPPGQADCCRLVAEQRARQVQSSSSGGGQQQQFASNTLAGPFALSRFKAQSVDKLNMNINLNYVKIGLNQRRARHLAAGAAELDQRLLCKQQQRRQQQQRRLETNDQSVCCLAGSQMDCARQTQKQQVYNYATTSGLISAVALVHSSKRLPPERASLASCRVCELSKFEGAADVYLASGGGRAYLRPVRQQQLALEARRLREECASCCPAATIYVAPSAAECTSAPLSSRFSGGYACCAAAAAAAAAPLRCCLEQQQQQRATTRNQAKGLARRYNLDGGATTDSSGYLSACDRRQPRLLKMCAAPKPPPLPPPPPPPPPAASEQASSRKLSSRITGGQKRLSTFVSSSDTSGCSLDSGRRANSSELSPQSYASASTSCSSMCPSTPTDSSLSAGPQSYSPLSLRPARLARLDKGGGPARHIPPPPPPMPVPDAELHCKPAPAARSAELELASQQTGGGSQRAASESGEQPKRVRQQLQLERQLADKQNRLCFVDELKMLAKQQQQQQHSSAGQQVTVESATLIKIINASKAGGSAPKRTCNCHARQESGAAEESLSPSGGQRAKCAAKCSSRRAAAAAQESSGGKSAKLSEEDNKRRQHGKCR